MAEGEKTFGVLCKCGHFRNEHMWNKIEPKKPTKLDKLLNSLDSENVPSGNEFWSICNKCSCKKYHPRKNILQFWK